MAENAIDSDLYGDIYGDDEDNEYEVPGEGQEGDETYDDNEDVKPLLNELSSSSTPTTEGTSYGTAQQTQVQDNAAHRSLPPKPSTTTTTTGATSSSALSYSAQVAKQFSVYQQTPSQERQQRKEIPLPPNPRANVNGGGSAGATRQSFVVPSSVEKQGTGVGQATAGDTVFGKKPSEMHDAGKMFIGGLNWDTTDEGLVNYFSQFGKVDACTIMRDPAGTSRGFAFMTFEDPNAVDAVLARDHQVDGKTIDPKRAIPREEHLRNTRYFVGGLSSNTTPDSMRMFFSDYGKVVDATVMLDRESGRSKGFGFVTFEDASNADQLIGKPGLMLDDKQIEVKAAQPRSQRDQTRGTSTHTTTTPTESFDQRPAPVPAMNFQVPQQQQQNPMTMMYQRSMAQTPLAMMGMNPMMSMMMNGYGMGNIIPGMNMMSGGMDAMANMGNMAAAGMGGGIRLGVGPVGNMGGMRNPMQMGAGVVQQFGNVRGNGTMGLRPMNGAQNFNGIMGNAGLGPARTTTRGQHSFHPYSR